MGEFAPAAPEQHENHEKHLDNLAELRAKAKHELAAENSHEASAEEARASIERAVENSANLNPVEEHEGREAAAQAAPQHMFVDRELRKITASRELKHIRRALPAPSRAFSRVVHAPVVQAVSEAAAKTVSRPSGLLGGGVMAFLGTTGYLLLAKHLGFQYNYLLFLMLFVSGFVIGLVLEFVLHGFSRKRVNT